MPQHPDATKRRAIRVLSMVGELHKRGYQRLRVMPYVSPSGAYWRCVIGPVDAFYRNHGAILSEGASPAPIASYSSSQENEYFGWNDAGEDGARALAEKFVQRFDRLGEAERGWDYPYAGWYVHVLGLAERGWVPVVLADGVETRFNCVPLDDVRSAAWKDDRDDGKPFLSMPPAGELRQDYPCS